MKVTAGDKRRKHLGAMAAVLCALVASLALAAGSAAAEESDSAPIRNISDGGFYFPNITGPTAPEEYPFQLNDPGPEIEFRQVSEQKVIAEYIEGGNQAWDLEALPATDAVGATVPTTLKLAEGDVLVLTVHFRAGNPAAGGAPFVYPIVEGEGWEGGYRTFSVPLVEPRAAPTEPTTPVPAVQCVVPALDGFNLRATKARLRSHHCKLGRVHLAHGATAAKGKVVKQFHVAGTELTPGARVAVKLG
jgi:hypothetical protein